MLEAFKDEDNFTVWSSISNIVGRLNLLFAYTDYHANFKAYGRHLFGAIEEKLGWEPSEKESMCIHFNIFSSLKISIKLTNL